MNSVRTDLARAEIGRLQGKINSLRGKKVRTDADRQAIADSITRIRELQGQINGLRGKTLIVNVRRVVTGIWDAATKAAIGGLGLSQNDTLKFATSGMSMWGAPVGGAVNVETGPTNVDARVYIDGEPMRAIARTTVRHEAAASAHRARYGRR